MIRKYQEKDTEAVIEAWYQASLIAHPFLSDAFLEQEATNLRELFLPHSQTWVYDDKGEIAGFLSMVDNVVGGIFVHPNWQRAGVGTALMNQAKSLHDDLELDVFEANPIGRSFYAKYGFVPVGNHIDEATGEPAIKLRFTKEKDSL